MPIDRLDDEEQEIPKEDEPPEESMNLSGLLSGMGNDHPRCMAIFGEIDEEKSSEICVGFLLLGQQKKDTEEPPEPIDLYLSTYGGNADDMFAIYDMMNMVKRSCEVRTFGIGKVMSAGVLLLANGTAGKRKVGKHCRIMIHSCNAGQVGDIHNLKNEMQAIQHQQDQYINALVESSTMTKRQLSRLLDKKVNVYLTAEEAIEYGIADELI